MPRRWYWLALDGLKAALALLAIAAAVAFLAGRSKSPGPVEGWAIAIDGDSLRIAGRELRLQGIDAPEYRQFCHGDFGDTPCGRQARDALAAWLARGPVSCADHGRDRFGRILAVCRSGDADINAALVASGNAVAFGGYEAEEAEARRRQRGVWATRFEKPADFRARQSARSAR